MVGTPIFDELRDLFEKSRGRFGAAGVPGAGPRSEATGSSEPGRGPTMIVVAGGRGVGKTTFVRSVADTDSLDSGTGTDFGQITLHPGPVLYLFGTSEPPPAGFGGVLGAVVLVDPRRITDAFATITYFENGSDVPFIVAVNMFDGEFPHELDEVREALALEPEIPLMACDARNPASSAKALQELVSHTLAVTFSGSPHGSPSAEDFAPEEGVERGKQQKG
ncbi:MAG: GTP-binding protein [Pseudonocardiaceae bacterium]